MSELSSFEIFTRNILYLIGWLINRIRYIFVGGSNFHGFNSDLLWLTFGLLFAFAVLHIFKRFLRKG